MFKNLKRFHILQKMKKVQLGTLFVPYLEPSGKRVPKRVLYMFKNLKRFHILQKNCSKEPKKVLKMVLKTHLEPFREPLKVPPVGQPKNPFFSKSVYRSFLTTSAAPHPRINACGSD